MRGDRNRAPSRNDRTTVCWSWLCAFCLLASITWGASDFLGGMMGRRMPTTVVVLWSLSVGMVLAVVAALIFPADHVAVSDFAWGAVAGAGGRWASIFYTRHLLGGGWP